MIPNEVTIPPNSESHLKISLKPTGQDNLKYFKGRVILETNHPGEKWLGLPYFIKVDRGK